MAMVLIQRRISQILEAKYPNVRWVWESPRAREDIMAGNKVYVILNRAGGYRRGQVLIRNLQVFDVIFENPEQRPDPVPQPPVPPTPAADPEDAQEEDEKTKEKRSVPVIILEDIEYCFSGGSKNSGEGKNATFSAPEPANNYAAPPASDPMNGGFTGFQSYGGCNSFF